MSAINFEFGASIEGFVRATREMCAELSKTNSAAAQLQDQMAKSMATLGQNGAEANSQLSGLNEQLQGMHQSLAAGVKIGGLTAAIAGVQQLGASIWDAVVTPAAAFERMQVAFEPLLGGADAAKKHVQQLRDYAASTPFSLDEVSTASRNLIAMGVSADKSMRVLRQLGDVAAVSGKDVAALAMVYAKNFAAGKLYTGDANELGAYGLNVRGFVAESRGLSQQGATKALSTGQVNASVMDDLLAAETGSGGKFNEGAAKISETLEGLISTLKDNITAAMIELGGGLAESMKAPLAQITSLVQAHMGTIRNIGSLVGSLFKGLITVIASVGRGVAGAFGVVLIGKFAAILARIPAILTAMTTRVIAFGVGLNTAVGWAGKLRFAMMAIGKVGWMLILTGAIEALIWAYEKFMKEAPDTEASERVAAKKEQKAARTAAALEKEAATAERRRQEDEWAENRAVEIKAHDEAVDSEASGYMARMDEIKAGMAAAKTPAELARYVESLDKVMKDASQSKYADDLFAVFQSVSALRSEVVRVYQDQAWLRQVQSNVGAFDKDAQKKSQKDELSRFKQMSQSDREAYFDEHYRSSVLNFGDGRGLMESIAGTHRTRLAQGGDKAFLELGMRI